MIAYVTDLEGQWDKLASFAQGNPHVALAAEGRLGDGIDRLELAPGVTFVFGGDAVDRGPGGRRIMRTLVAARREYGERVILLAGNRDINKLRLRDEIDRPPPFVPPLPSAAERLRWSFAHTMGAPRAFEHRAAALGGAGDDTVVQSFRDDVAPGGDVLAFLGEARLAYRAGATLFVHGGVTAENLFTAPGRARARDVDGWIAALNDFYASELARFVAGGDAEELIAYQAPLPGTHANQTSVVYGRPTDELGNPELPPPDVIAALRASGIERVVVGHTPSGDCPALVRADGFELVLADNSYGRIEHGSQLALDDTTTAVHATTQLDDGTTAEVAFAARRDLASPLGTHDATGALVKARLADGRYLHFRALPDRKVEQIAR